RPDSHAFDIDAEITFEAPLDLRTLQAAFSALSQRHDMLRTCFQRIDGVLRRRLVDASPIVIGPMSAVPFDLTHEPPWRAAVTLDAAERVTVLALRFHHVGFDLHAIATFLSELERAYADPRSIASRVVRPRVPNAPGDLRRDAFSLEAQRVLLPRATGVDLQH